MKIFLFIFQLIGFVILLFLCVKHLKNDRKDTERIILLIATGLTFIAFLAVALNDHDAKIQGDKEKAEQKERDRETNKLLTFLKNRIDSFEQVTNIIVTSEKPPIIERFLDISSYTESGVCLKKGNRVILDASGQIVLGPRAGNSGPNGKESSMDAWFLNSFSITQDISHGALMYRYGSTGSWEHCGEHKEFIATRDGCLSFEVNDRQKRDNSGVYQIGIKVYE